MKRLFTVIRAHPVISAIFCIAATVFLWLLINLLFIGPPKDRFATPAPWMTPNYIANSWHVDATDVAMAVGLTDRPKGRPTFDDIAKMRGVPVETVLTEVIGFLALQSHRND
ncbi:hypothetical protein BVC71_04450 [Marivivens niveibacter]|uniref:Uncharacterized protein n=1 Tax=Marivivens niveibacter TaxID=1930667 RepID=A0A251X2E1_9RHOB|nr:hypothetical protein [Marivivens niveibacter]OUD10741.1 hypothetical protein BVC71_04450 [Marivivens niveibacter]